MLTIGRIVHYTLSEEDARAINRRRDDYWSERPEETGFQAHVGNHVAAGEVYPALVVRVWNETGANLQVLLDGNDAYWATSRVEGDGPNTWSWPQKV